MSVVWQLNGTPLAELGMEIVSGSMRAAGVSRLRLRRGVNFDDTTAIAAGAAATLTRTEGATTTTVFSGKIETVTPTASGSAESQTYILADAWAELEKTIYQEEWNTTTGQVWLPRAVLGLGKNTGTGLYERLTIGEQIRRVLNYAISQGVALQVGSVPAGETMIPEEIENMTCVEVLARCLKLHPDWIPRINHTTTPPTISVSAAGGVAASIALDGGTVLDFEVTQRTDLIPASVRIIYELADEIDGEVYRKTIIDKHPGAGPDGGPRCIQSVIPLSGMRMQIQKSRLQTRALPTNQADAKAWLTAKFPAIAEVDPDHFFVTEWARELVVEDPEDFPEEISPRAARKIPETADDVPRELVRGNIEDWMRVKVGRVNVRFAVRALGAATAAEKQALLKLPAGITITCTNALTKTYKSLSHWEAAEDVPAGIAAATYGAIVAAAAHSGSVTIGAADVDFISYAGASISLTGGETDWATMDAPVHSVDFDIGAGETTIGFGPNPSLAPVDFIELQRILRFRPATWWGFAERGSDQFGATGAASALGDTVGGFDGPENIPDQVPGIVPPFHVELTTKPGEGDDPATYAVTVAHGLVCERIISAIPPAGAIQLWEAENRLDEDDDPTEFPIAVGQGIFVRTYELGTGRIGAPESTPPDPEIPAVALVVLDKDEASQNHVPQGTPGVILYRLASLVAGADPGDPPDLVPDLSGSHIFRASGLTADMILEDCAGDQYADPVVPGNQLIRLSFSSGVLASLNESEDDRPPAAVTVREQFTPCSETGV